MGLAERERGIHTKDKQSLIRKDLSIPIGKNQGYRRTDKEKIQRED